MAGIIRIIKTPAGEAPPEVREEWVGLELPCTCIQDESNPTREKSWWVPQREALVILGQKNAAVAGWFRSQGFPVEHGYFCFASNEAAALDGYIPNLNEASFLARAMYHLPVDFGKD